MQENSNNFPFDQLKEIEENKSIPLLYEEAKRFLDKHKRCRKVIRGCHDGNFSVLDKLGIFLFEIEPTSDDVDRYIWIIVGDLPSVYLDACVETSKEALEAYCDLMEEWSTNVLQGGSLEECYPVEAESTNENAELLKRRIAFIRKELLSVKRS